MNNQDCTICTRYQKCNKVCQVPKFKESEVLMIVGDSPSKESDNGLTAMSGKYEILKSVLKQVLKVDFDKIYFTHAVKCYDPDLIIDNQIESCNDYLAEEINLVKPKVILTLGKTATLGLLEEKDFKGANFNKITGKKYHQIDNETKLEFTVIPVYSPKYISFNKGALKQWAKDIYTAYNLATDTEVVFEQTKIQIVDTPELLLDLIQHTKTSGWMSHDFETTGLDTFAEDFKLTCFSLSFQHGSSWVIPLHHKDSPLLETYKGYLELVNRELLQDPNVIKIAHNLQYEKDCWATLGVKSFRGRIIDTMLQHYLLYNDKPHGLKMIIPDYFPEYDGYDMEVSKHNWDNVPYNILVNYCGIDSDLTLRLAVQFENELLQQPRLYDIFRNLLMPALQTYWAAHNAGIEIDVDYLEDAIIEVDKLIAVQDGILREIPTVYKYDLHRTEEEQEALIKSLEGKYKVAEDKWVVSTDKMRATGEAKIQAWYEGQFNKDIDDDVLENKRTEKLHKLEEKLCKRIEGSVRMNNYLKQISDIKAGIIQPIEPLNFGSHTQLGGLLYDKQGFGMKKPIDWKTGKEGGTGVAILKDFEGVEIVEFVDSLLLLRSLNKTQSTYLRGIQRVVDEHGLVHPSFLLHGTVTGRSSCVGPNVTNITQPDRIKNPIAKSAAIHVKKIFTVPEGYTWVQCDFSQLELRLIAWYSQCKYMLDAYDKDIDLHSLTAADVAGISLEEFLGWEKKKRKAARTNAKPVNFGWNYRQSPKGFQEFAKNNYGIEFTLAQAEKLKTIYFDKRPELLDYHDLYIAKANQFKYVRTRLGSKTMLADIDSWEKYKVGAAERLAVNAPIQGTGGQLNIFAANQIQKYIRPSTRFIFSVHDSNNYYIKNEYLREEISKIKYLSENLPLEDYFGVTFNETEKKRGVKLKVDIETTTTTWKDLQELPNDYEYLNIF